MCKADEKWPKTKNEHVNIADSKQLWTLTRAAVEGGEGVGVGQVYFL